MRRNKRDGKNDQRGRKGTWKCWVSQKPEERSIKGQREKVRGWQENIPQPRGLQGFYCRCSCPALCALCGLLQPALRLKAGKNPATHLGPSLLPRLSSSPGFPCFCFLSSTLLKLCFVSCLEFIFAMPRKVCLVEALLVIPLSF